MGVDVDVGKPDSISTFVRPAPESVLNGVVQSTSDLFPWLTAENDPNLVTLDGNLQLPPPRNKKPGHTPNVYPSECFSFSREYSIY